MTATIDRPTTVPAEAPVTTVEPGTTFRRRVAGATFLGAAAITMAGILATPFEHGSSEKAYLQSLVDSPKQAMIAAILLHFGYLLFVPASFTMARLARRGARKLSAAGIALATLGVGLSGLLVTDIYDLSIARHAGTTGGVPISNMTDVPLAGLGFITVGMLTALGATLGLSLLAGAMRRARLAPLWPSIAIFVGLAIGYGAHSLTRTAIGFAMMCGAIAYLGSKVLRMSDQRFTYGSDAR